MSSSAVAPEVGQAGPTQQPVSPAALPTLLFVVFMNLLGFGMVVPLLPFFAKSFHAAPWQISLVFSAYAMGGFIGEPFWGRLSDRIGRRPVLISTLACNCITYGFMAFAPNIWAAFLIRFLGGIFAGNGSVVQGYIADVTPPEDRPGKLARIGVAYNIGFIVGPTLAGALARPELGPVGFRAPFLVASLLAALSSLGVTLLVRESRARRTDMLNQPSRWALFGAAVSHPVVGPLLLLTLASGFAFNGIESIFGFWGQKSFGWGPRQIAIVFGFVGVTNAGAQWFITGRLSRAWGQARALAVGMAVTVGATLLIPLSRGLVTVTLFMALMAFGQSVAFPNVGALISRVAHQDRQGQALGLNNATGAMARFLGPLASGIVFSAVSIEGPFYLAALVVAPAILLALAAGKRLTSAPVL
jgi:MFS family permease